MTRFIIVFAALLAAFSVPARADDPKNEDEKTLYALGLALARELQVFSLNPAETEQVKRGFADALAGRKPLVDLDAYGPKIQALAQSRRAVAGEKAAASGKEFLDKAEKVKKVDDAFALLERLGLTDIETNIGKTTGVPIENWRKNYEARKPKSAKPAPAPQPDKFPAIPELPKGTYVLKGATVHQPGKPAFAGTVVVDALKGEIVRVIAAVTTTRVLLQVLDGPRTTVDLPVDRGTWASALDAGVAVILPASTTHHGPRAWAPWALLGAGLASAAAGVAFGVSAQDASNALSVGLPSPESRELLDRSAAHGTAANLLWLTAAASVLTGMVWVTLDP